MKNLNETKDVFVDTVLISDEVLVRKIKNTVSNLKLSVILSSYRKAKNLINMIDLLLAQTYKNFEIIIVDDLSGNEIEDVFEKYNKYDNINYIKKQLGSKAGAKNIGLYNAKGEYIIFLEEDIINLENNYLESLYKKINNTHADIVILANANNIEFLTSNFNMEELLTGEEFLKEEILKYKNNIDSSLASLIFKKQFLNIYNLNFNAEVLENENILFKVQVFDKAKKIEITQESSFIKKYSRRFKDNNVLKEATAIRMLTTINKIEKFVMDKGYNNYGNLLCGYLYLELLAENKDKDIEKIIIKEIMEKKNYFSLDSFTNKLWLAISPKLFAKRLVEQNRED